MRFFYGTTLGRKDIADQLPFARKEDTLPSVLLQDEVLRLLKAESNLKMRTACTAIYAGGLRVSEVVALTIKDIDSTRKVIHIRQAKGRKDRCVMLSEQLLIIVIGKIFAREDAISAFSHIRRAYRSASKR